MKVYSLISLIALFVIGSSCSKEHKEEQNLNNNPIAKQDSTTKANSDSLIKSPIVLFVDSFQDNRNNWRLINTSEFRMSISNGKLNVEKIHTNRENNGCLWYMKTIPNFNSNSDFKIQFDIKITKGGDMFESFDIYWGNPDKLYNFDFNNPDSFRFNKFDKSTTSRWEYITRIYKSNIIKPAEFNKVEIVQKADSNFIYFNDSLIMKHKVELITGQTIGFVNALKGAWEMDNLSITKER